MVPWGIPCTCEIIALVGLGVAVVGVTVLVVNPTQVRAHLDSAAQKRKLIIDLTVPQIVTVLSVGSIGCCITSDRRECYGTLFFRLPVWITQCESKQALVIGLISQSGSGIVTATITQRFVFHLVNKTILSQIAHVMMIKVLEWIVACTARVLRDECQLRCGKIVDTHIPTFKIRVCKKITIGEVLNNKRAVAGIGNGYAVGIVWLVVTNAIVHSTAEWEFLVLGIEVGPRPFAQPSWNCGVAGNSQSQVVL